MTEKWLRPACLWTVTIYEADCGAKREKLYQSDSRRDIIRNRRNRNTEDGLRGLSIGGIQMATTTFKEEVMTDKQLMSIIEMVLQILARSKDIEDARKALLAIKYGEETKNEE
jgi:hypothetical protein